MFWSRYIVSQCTVVVVGCGGGGGGGGGCMSVSVK